MAVMIGAVMNMQLDNNKQLLKTVADLIPCGLVVLSERGTIEMWNCQLQQITGLNELEVKSRPWSEVAVKFLVHGGEPLENLMQSDPPEVSSEVRHVGRQCEMISAGGELVPVDILFFPVPSSSGVFGEVESESSLVGIFSWSGDDKRFPDRDQVGGFPSQYELSFMLPQQLALLARYNIPFTLLFLEIKNCQVVIDSLGLDAWNSTLRTIYESLQSIVRRADFVGGYDHATFWLMLANASENGSSRVAEKMLLHASRITVENADTALDAVVGGAIARSGETPDAFFTRAYGGLQQAHKVDEGIFIDK